MRQDTAVILTKGICYVMIGVFTPWSAALGQWVGTGEWPSRIVWLGVIVPASMVGGATQLLGFLSGSYTKYLEAKEPLTTTADEVEVLKQKQAAVEAAKLLAVKSEAKLAEVKAELADTPPAKP